MKGGVVHLGTETSLSIKPIEESAGKDILPA